VCGKIGHKGTDCWTLESNKEKRPTGYNEKNDGNKNYKFIIKTISSTAIATIATKRAIKKLIAGQNSWTTQTT